MDEQQDRDKDVANVKKLLYSGWVLAAVTAVTAVLAAPQKW